MASQVSQFFRSAQSMFARRKARRAGTFTKRAGLWFESLEPRAMLAGDMAEIRGVVLNDLQGDGNPNNDLAMQSVVVNLYRDGGDGVFNQGGGDDTITMPARLTDANGRYSFAGVTAGTYFVKITPAAGQHSRPGGDVQKVVVTANEAEGALGVKIDDFETFQQAVASPPLPSSTPSLQLDSGVLGGQRDMFIQLTEGVDPYSEVSLTSGVGLLRLASDTTVTGNAKVIWDGVDSDAEAVNPTGLGGLDLSTHEGATMTGISLTVGADHPNTIVKLKVYSNANNWSEYTTTVPVTPGGAATKNVVFQFADQPTSTSGSGANIANVGAIELTFEGVSAVDGQVSVIELVGLTPKHANFTVYDRMSLGDLVWREIFNDGLHQSEPGIANVKLNLFEDTDNNGHYTPGVDALFATTTTNSNGNYLFSDLFPGKYLVQVDPTNFVAAGPLNGLRSSTGNGVAPSPDNDVNGDDNGEPLAGFGVVSQALTLIARSEPINDGDNDPNTNLTVDFGFFGFDLAIDKDIEEDAAVPGEQLHFTIKVTNSGTTTAENVVFTDELPPEVRFVSGTTSRGTTLTADSNGRIESNFGNMAAGETITINIVTDVLQGIGAKVINEASVSTTTDELDLSNNTDMDMVPVTPKIDLAITKIDSRDPVNPGETFSYTVTARNHGPSDATGVKVSDLLPAGVTFVSATPVHNRVENGKLMFDIGHMAAGATRTFTITVRVNEDFHGTLLNEVWIAGNEPEIRTDNNHDDEPTVVPEPLIDLAVTKADSRDPVEPGSVFSYLITAVNHGPSKATGVIVSDDLPNAVAFQSASKPHTVADGKIMFDVGELAVGATWQVTINVQVDDTFTGTLVNEVWVHGNQTETRTDNNHDDEPTLVRVEPTSISGTVFVDRNDNGQLDASEPGIPNVAVQLVGVNFRGDAVNHSTTTNSNGFYSFTNLMPGTYSVRQTEQPATFLGRKLFDGKDELGDNGDGISNSLNGFKAPDLNSDDDRDSDAFDGIVLLAGKNATNYNFGELMLTVSKRDFVRGAVWNL